MKWYQESGNKYMNQKHPELQVFLSCEIYGCYEKSPATAAGIQL